MTDSPSQEELLWMARDELLRSMQKFGVKCHPRGRTILCSELPIQVHCFDVLIPDYGEGHVVSLAIQLSLGGSPRSPVISECIMGRGSGLEDAIRSAVFEWMQSVLVASIAWFDPEKCVETKAWDETFDFPDWYGQKRRWRLISSPLVAVGEWDINLETLRNMTTKEALMPLFEEIMRFPGTHWVKATVFNGPCDCWETTADCTVDSKDSKRGKQLLISSSTLPKAPLLRQFHILTSTHTQAIGAMTSSPRIVKVSARNWKH